MANDPLHQFHIDKIIPLNVGGNDVSITTASVFIVGGACLGAAVMYLGARKAAIVPSRGQSMVEMLHNFVADSVRKVGGDDLMKFFPFIFTLFLAIFSWNMVGMFPYAYTTTSHILVPAILAMIVIATMFIVGFAKNGFGFLRLFVPSGVPWPLLLLLVPIEIFSVLSRPITLTMRLWANVFAGHMVLKVFAGFVPALGEGLGAVGWVAALGPLALVVAFTALEFLVAFLQAYVFAVLTSVYLNDALHPGH